MTTARQGDSDQNGDDMSVSITSNTSATRDNSPERKTAPALRQQRTRGLTSTSVLAEGRLVMSIVSHSPTRNPQARPTRQDAPATLPRRHWYVAGEGGYCQACGLPARNTSQHAPRDAAA